ncbi:MAG TPA: lectin-like protein [Verrucomicrobiae bacterium]
MKIIAFCAVVLLFAAARLRADIVAGPITNPANGHDYYLLTPNTWTASEAEAESLGGTLAVIRIVKEQDWVFSTFGTYSGTNRDLWIGLCRMGAQRTLEWVTGERLNYANWAGGQPDDAGGRESCVFLASSNRPWGFPAGGWADIVDNGIVDGCLPYAVVELSGKAHQLSLSKSERALIGNWYEGGNIERPCWIVGTDRTLFRISNNHLAERVTMSDDGLLHVVDFQTQPRSAIVSDMPAYQYNFPHPFSARPLGIHGEVIRDKILWSDGTWWSQKPLPADALAGDKN